MPVYIAPAHPDCRKECPGTGGAVYIPPHTCRAWCDDPEPVVQAFSAALAKDGWRFKSTLRGAWIGAHAKRVGHSLLNYSNPAPPDWIRRTIEQIIELGGKYPETIFGMAWPMLRFGPALRTVAIAMSDRVDSE
jgi:hypothetical protein